MKIHVKAVRSKARANYRNFLGTLDLSPTDGKSQERKESRCCSRAETKIDLKEVESQGQADFIARTANRVEFSENPAKSLEDPGI